MLRQGMSSEEDWFGKCQGGWIYLLGLFHADGEDILALDFDVDSKRRPQV